MDNNIKLIIACEAFRGELETFKSEINVPIIWIKQALHNEPDNLHFAIKEKISEAEKILDPGELVLLFFGNCGKALSTIYSETLNLTHPDVADCIPVILGSMENFLKLQSARPGSFYLNKNWIDAGEDPLHTSEKYIKSYGEKKGWKIAKVLYKNYKHFVLIDNGCYDLDDYRKYVQESCLKFEKEYIEEQGNLEFVKAILNLECPMVNIKPNDPDRINQTYQSRAAFLPVKD